MSKSYLYLGQIVLAELDRRCPLTASSTRLRPSIAFVAFSHDLLASGKKIWIRPFAPCGTRRTLSWTLFSISVRSQHNFLRPVSSSSRRSFLSTIRDVDLSSKKQAVGYILLRPGSISFRRELQTNQRKGSPGIAACVAPENKTGIDRRLRSIYT